ncbi:uncharacterized protein [Aristolochia californica]|uniref:uncharacterized protein n=1 Tax=Aristolochia californica TaxID=171875 RepID=UPI0035D59977
MYSLAPINCRTDSRVRGVIPDEGLRGLTPRYARVTIPSPSANCLLVISVQCSWAELTLFYMFATGKYPIERRELHQAVSRFSPNSFSKIPLPKLFFSTPSIYLNVKQAMEGREERRGIRSMDREDPNNVVSDRSTLDDSSSPEDIRQVLSDLQQRSTLQGTEITNIHNTLHTLESSLQIVIHQLAAIQSPTPPPAINFQPQAVHHPHFTPPPPPPLRQQPMRFGPPASSNPMGELINYKQTGTLELYQKKFQERFARASEFVPPHLHVQIFNVGLTEAVRLEVELLGPTDFHSAMNYARVVEQKQRGTAPGPHFGSSAPNRANQSTIVTPHTLPRKFLIKQEMEARKAKGLCFNCDENFLPGDTCKHLFSIELWEESSEELPENEFVEEEQQEPELSLHAMHGLRSSNTTPYIVGLSRSDYDIYSTTRPDYITGYCDTAFADLFNDPTGLPPVRHCDHRIHLKLGTDPVVVHPYRYPHIQKDEIERQCMNMLAQGVIQPSRSPFSSPVLLVRKKDKSWRFCVDYWQLNLKTIKDKFPIPVVDDLLDELHDPNVLWAEVAYLSHIISVVEVDQSKIQAIAAPLNNLLKKHAFNWSSSTDQAFQLLKETLAPTPVLKLPDFDEDFVVECDVSEGGCPTLATLFMGITIFIRIDNCSSNLGADALSHQNIPDPHVYALSNPRSLLLDSIREETNHYPELISLYQDIQHGTTAHHWMIHDRLILYKNKIFMLHTSPLLPTILFSIHDSTHEGQQKTYVRISWEFYWKGMKSTIADYVAACQICQ